MRLLLSAALLSLLGAPATGLAQSTSPLTAHLLADDGEAGFVTLTAEARATALDSASTYRYTLRTAKTDSAGTARNTQSGSFDLSVPVASLARVRLGVGAGASLGARLDVYRGDSLVASAMHGDTSALRAPEPAPPQSAPDLGLEIDGLIIDETRSKAGRDFYDLFYGKWQAPAGVTGFSIVLKEFPTRGRVARVGVVVDGTTVYQPLLQPRQSMLELAAEQAVRIVARHLAQRKQLDAQLADPDQAGSGIF